MLQIVAGADYRIVAARMGYAGNSHDSTIMKKRSFWKNRENIFTPEARVIEGLGVPYFEIGDSASPIMRSMKPYTHTDRCPSLLELQAFECNDDCRRNTWAIEGKVSDPLVYK